MLREQIGVVERQAEDKVRDRSGVGPHVGTGDDGVHAPFSESRVEALEAGDLEELSLPGQIVQRGRIPARIGVEILLQQEQDRTLLEDPVRGRQAQARTHILRRGRNPQPRQRCAGAERDDRLRTLGCLAGRVRRGSARRISEGLIFAHVAIRQEHEVVATQVELTHVPLDFAAGPRRRGAVDDQKAAGDHLGDLIGQGLANGRVGGHDPGIGRRAGRRVR